MNKTLFSQKLKLNKKIAGVITNVKNQSMDMVRRDLVSLERVSRLH